MSKVVLITGISSGFGKGMAELLSENGHKVYGTVRQEIECKQGIQLLKMELKDSESIKRAVGLVVQKEGRIDILINNAGMPMGGAIEDTPLEIIKLLMDVNFMGMVHLIREVLPHMRNQRNGMIINFSSIGGLMGLPFQAYYSASKFAIEGLSEALRMELKPFNIKVVVINPGDFHTNCTISRRNFLSNTENGPYAGQFCKTLTIIEKDEKGGSCPDLLARKVAKIIGHKNPNHRYIIASAEQKLAVLLNIVLPKRWFRKILESHYGIK